MKYYEAVRLILGIPKLTPGAKMVLLYLFDKQGQNGGSWPSITTIGNGCRLANSTVTEATTALEKAGLLKIQRCKNPSAKKTNHYTVTLSIPKTGMVQESDHTENRTRPYRKSGNTIPKIGCEPYRNPDTNGSMNGSVTAPAEKPAQNSSASGEKKFTKPTVVQIAEYADSIGYDLNVEKFFRYYEANSWTVGKDKKREPMSCWKLAVLAWQARDKSNIPAKTEDGLAECEPGTAEENRKLMGWD